MAINKKEELESRAAEVASKLEDRTVEVAEKVANQTAVIVKNQSVEVAENLVVSASQKAIELINIASAEAKALIEEAAIVAKDLRSRVKHLEGIIPICSYCKSIRDGEETWHQLEAYITKYTDAEFSYGICPDCYEKHKDG